MKESAKLEIENKIGVRVLQIAFLLVMGVIYAILGAIFLLSGIAFLMGIEGLEILTFSSEGMPMIFLAITGITLGIVVIIIAGILATFGLRQKNIAH